MSYHLFTQEQVDFILDNYQNCTVEQLTHMMCGLFDYNFTIAQIKNKIKDLQIRKRKLKKNFGTYTPEMCQWLKDHYNTIRVQELTDQFNKAFNVDYTKSAIWHKVNRIIEGGIVRDEHKMISRVKWTNEMIEWLKDHFEDDSYNRLAIKMNSIFNVKVTGSSLEHKVTRLGLKKSKESIKRFILPNKGCFQKGHIPPSYNEPGTEVVRRDGYTWVKVEGGMRQKARLVYEQHHGPIPPGYNVLFADGDKSNFDINNLVLVSNAELGTINKQGLLYKGCGEATKCGITIAKIMIRRNQRAKK